MPLPGHLWNCYRPAPSDGPKAGAFLNFWQRKNRHKSVRVLETSDSPVGVFDQEAKPKIWF